MIYAYCQELFVILEECHQHRDIQFKVFTVMRTFIFVEFEKMQKQYSNMKDYYTTKLPQISQTISSISQCIKNVRIYINHLCTFFFLILIIINIF